MHQHNHFAVVFSLSLTRWQRFTSSAIHSMILRQQISCSGVWLEVSIEKQDVDYVSTAWNLKGCIPTDGRLVGAEMKRYWTRPGHKSGINVTQTRAAKATHLRGIAEELSVCYTSN